jgi:hypothetical protein
VPSRLHGPATRAAATDQGLTDWQLRHREIARLSRDTYLPSSDVADLRDRLPAVLLTAPPGTVVSHATAAALWKIEIPLQRADSAVHLTVPWDSRARNRADRRIHRGRPASGEITRRWGLSVTTPARTWRDLAGVLPPSALLAVSDQLLALWTDRAELMAMLAAHPTGRGAGRARRVLPVADQWAESPMESVLRWLLHEAGLPTPVLQHVVKNRAGLFLGRADLAWPDRKVLVEFDGDVHRDRGVFVADLRRQNLLVAAGWTVLRFSSADVLGHPHRVIEAVRAALS